jgi:hypothetical protein
MGMVSNSFIESVVVFVVVCRCAIGQFFFLCAVESVLMVMTSLLCVSIVFIVMRLCVLVLNGRFVRFLNVLKVLGFVELFSVFVIFFLCILVWEERLVRAEVSFVVVVVEESCVPSSTQQ